ncbi:hypothetical protein [Halopenitus sp. POP-27]|nr:hypothetical protein [Halopenitus sp. POP-27]
MRRPPAGVATPSRAVPDPVPSDAFVFDRTTAIAVGVDRIDVG